MLVIKHLMVAIDFQYGSKKMQWKSIASVKCLVTNIL